MIPVQQSNKRQRVIVAGPRRPIDKLVFQVSRTASTTATQDPIYTASEAVTFTGGVLRGNIYPNQSNTGVFNWTLQYIPENFNIIDITPVTGGITFFEPEQYILASGTFTNPTNVSSTGLTGIVIYEKIETMRKMKKGDTLQFITDSSGNQSVVS